MNTSSLWKHIAALVYDIFPILGIFLTTSLFVMLARGGEAVPAGTWWFQLLLLAELFLYFGHSWKSGGQTLGMRAWKLAIVDHRSMTWTQVSLRFAVGVVSTALLGLGLWARKFSSNQLTWMDAVSQTQTIDIKPST